MNEEEEPDGSLLKIREELLAICISDSLNSDLAGQDGIVTIHV